jgi:hypothetical protein
MNTAALMLLSVLIAPVFAVIAHGARRESWAILTLAGAVLAGAVVGIHYLIA